MCPHKRKASISLTWPAFSSGRRCCPSPGSQPQFLAWGATTAGSWQRCEGGCCLPGLGGSSGSRGRGGGALSLSNPEHHVLWAWVEEKRNPGKVETAKNQGSRWRPEEYIRGRKRRLKSCIFFSSISLGTIPEVIGVLCWCPSSQGFGKRRHKGKQKGGVRHWKDLCFHPES